MDIKIKILYIEYVHGDALTAGEILNKAGLDCKIYTATNRQAYLNALTYFTPQLILCDDALPGLNAVDALTVLREKAISIPLIVVTDAKLDNIAVSIVNIMKQGAFDYILKDHIDTLPGAVLSAIQKHKTEKKLLLNDQRYRQIVETAQEGIWILDENLQTVFVNKKMCDILGYTAAEMIGKHNYDFKRQEDKIHTLERTEQIKLGITEKHESEFFAKNGSKVLCSVATNGLFDTDGKFLGTLAMVTDITARKADEEALRRSEANLSAIIENTNDLVYSLDKDLKFITYNQLFKNITKQVYGFNIEQGVDTLSMVAEFDPEMARKWRGIYEKALNGEAQQFVNEYDFGTGKVYLSYSINPIWETGKVIGLSCFSRDITRQKLDETAVRKSEASLRTIFNNTDMGCILIDTEGRIVSFNNLARKLSYLINERPIEEGALMIDLLEKERQPIIADLLKQVKNGSTVNYQLRKEVENQIKWFDITMAGINDHENEDFGHIFTNKDITEKKILEIEREKITTDLIQRNKALEQFTYIISHNLRAPVANIIGLSSLFSGMDDVENGDIGQIIKSISHSANKLDAVISDLNQVLQVNEGLNENIELITLPELIEDIKISIENLIEKEQVKIQTHFSEVSEMLAIKSFIYSVFYNLILNSIKYRRPGVNPIIKITTEQCDGTIVITFKDNGRGIDTERHANEIFGLYKRFDTTIEGKGMGLFMVKMQVESMGGSVSLQSTINKGTEFRLEFPDARMVL